MGLQRLIRPCRLVRHDGEPALLVDSGCSGCAAACAASGVRRHIPLRWLGVDDEPAGEGLFLSIRAAGLSRAAGLCFGLPVVALLMGGAAGGALAAGTVVDPEIAAALSGLAAAWATLVWAAGRMARRLADLDPVLLRPGSSA